ncbi:LamG-like jellyroll fold domain-containing protein [Amycolatopsis sp. PS_44_ISF1]|uniref:LamG-like jellyroll fold domain-containing protein n=1 Tax=Amycolatopsis sp. PS_44_ISF1 TaxID=2974917 RepID=UPI0028DECDD8|nr:LamG-like jellyroll fold domain-containing protein [Amycolatopsis sp. PS_44_ISF1]MDT8913199.1 metallophosphoesterase [Amycolatopsis sp. PS_44_ISF1]
MRSTESDSCPENSSPAPAGPNRRTFLRTAGLAGVGATALGALPGAPASAATPGTTDAAASATAGAPGRWPGGTGRWNPDPDSPQFTLAVMPDTQFLYWGSQNSIAPEPQEASFRYVIDQSGNPECNIVFLAHLGDLTQDADPTSFEAVGRAFEVLDAHDVAYSVLAGNHDVSGDDTRGSTPYLKTMGPQRFRRSKSFLGADASGYNTAHVFRAAGRDWLLLAMDWRTSDAGFTWADQVIKAHPKLPVILTAHEIVGSTYDDDLYPYASGDPEDNAVVTDYGRQVWDRLIKDNDQVFLTLNGHYWPSGRVTKANSAGHDVHLHITNYQNRYFGGGGMLRLYHFDLERNTIDVETISPWILAQRPAERNRMAALESRLTTPVDRFSVPLDFDRRFAGFRPVPVRPARPAPEMLVPGTLAYWRFDGGADGRPVPGGTVVRDRSGRGNDLTPQSVPCTAADALTWSADHHPDQPGHASLRFTGGRNPLHGAYLATGAQAPLNAETFRRGYTIEAFVKIPLDWDANANGFMSVLSRGGQAGDAGKHGRNTDPAEPVAQLSISNNGREPQFNCYPLNQASPTTNWGHGLPEDTWWHLAVVNDGRRTRLYVESSPVADNPSTDSAGITSLGLAWMLGGHSHGGAVDQVFHGWVGDVRIVGRALRLEEFMTAR